MADYNQPNAGSAPAHFTSTSELLFASSSDQVLMQNLSHENDLILMKMNEQVT